ncbi:MAG: nucleoside hydrolase [Pseudomonadota bacterium]
MTEDWYRARLAPPGAGCLSVVIDTDAANEIDDQFALAWALLSPGRLRVLGVYAEPFSFAHRRAQLPHAGADAPPFCPPDIGMERSHEEILRVFGLLGLPVQGRALRGHPGYLPPDGPPQSCDAVDHLIATARAMPGDTPLYVVALGCPTNVAAALLLAPDIARRIVVVWTSGYPSHAPHANDSFNLEQDVRASHVLLDSGVPLVYLPGFHVGAQLRFSLAEADRYLRHRGAIGGYLHRLFTHNPLWAIYPQAAQEPYSWVIWDIITIAWLLEPDWVPSHIVPTPGLDDALRWVRRAGAPPMREAYAVQRDAIFRDLLAKLPGPDPDPAA